MKRYLPLAIIVFVGAGALTAGNRLYRAKRAELEASAVDAAPGNSAIKPGAKPAHILGEAKAPVTLEEFGDFQCPPCGTLAPIVAKLEREFGKKLRVVFREYPLPVHNHAAQAARVAEAAGRQDRFWEMHELLYRNQLIWTNAADADPIFLQYASDLKLDPDRFKHDLAEKEVSERIIADQQRAESLGVSRTPTLFINGRVLPPTSYQEAGLRSAIQNALEGKTPAPSATLSPTP
jgi:protein-disulfide isomerase